MMTLDYEIKYLTTVEQFDEAEKIYQSYDKVMRSSYDRSTEILSDKNNNNVKFVGCYYQGSLVAFLKIVVWDRLPVYVVGNMNIKKSFLQRYDFSNHKHPIIPIMNFILCEQETNKRYTWYYNRSLANSYHKLQLEGKDLLKNCDLGWDSSKQQYRYERFIEEKVTAGNLPYHPAHKTFQNKIFDTDYMIVKCCLRNEYRATPDYFNKETIRTCMNPTHKIKNI